MDKKKLLELLGDAYDNASNVTGETLGQPEIETLYNELDSLDATKVNQWMTRNKDKLAMIPELAGNASFIDVTENPKVVSKDYGFEEGPDFYKMEGPKSWMNKSPTQLRLNAEKYGLELGDYLNKVAELSTKKEQERQWKDNANVAEFKDVPVIGDVEIPGITRVTLPTSFNKASMGKEVKIGNKYKPWTWGSDVYFDIGTDILEGGLAATPARGKAKFFVNPIVAALTGNAARQGKQIYDETQDEFHPGEFAGSGVMGAFSTPALFKGAADIMKRVPGTQGIKQWTRASKALEDIGEVDPNTVLSNKVDELSKATQKYRDVGKLERQKVDDALAQIAQETGVINDYVPFNPTPAEIRLYGKGPKLWRNVKNREILSDQEYKDAMNFLTEAERGPNFIPGKPSQSNLYRRATEINKMPMGDILVNAWSEPTLAKVLRQGGRTAGGVVGGRTGISISDNDKKEMANRIINSTEWAKYVTGLPSNLTDEEIYLATMYGDE